MRNSWCDSGEGKKGGGDPKLPGFISSPRIDAVRVPKETGTGVGISYQRRIGYHI